MNKCIHCEGSGKAACKTCNGEGKVTCPTCGGSGREMSICPTCVKGKVADRRSFDDEPTLVCPDCHGEWQKDVGPCKACNGTGKVTCSSCAGKGKVSCPTCKGQGKVDVEAFCNEVATGYPEIDSGTGFLQDGRVSEEMLAVLVDAAKSGSGVAARTVGDMYAQGMSFDGKPVLDKDDKKANAYLQKGAELGDAFSQLRFAHRLHDGIGCDVDNVSAYNWLNKAADMGCVEALYALAEIHIIGGWGQGVNLKKAMECFQGIITNKDKDSEWDWSYRDLFVDSAEGHLKFLPGVINGDVKAMRDLGIWFSREPLHGRGLDASLCINKINPADFWLEKAASTGDLESMITLAEHLWQGSLRKKEPANEWYKKAAEAGDIKAQAIIGEHLRCGDGVEKDACKAFVYLYQAAEKGDIVALRHLAHLYRDGEYAEKNRRKANELYVRAAKAGDGWSLYEIGKCYLSGTEVEKNEPEAKRLLKLAVEKGVAEAKKALSSIPDSVKDKNKGPSGIVVGKPDGGSLPKFAKVDYNNAVAGKPSEKSSVKKGKSTSASSKKRWRFIVLGIVLGFFGIHLAYAKRWLLFLLLWVGFITGNVMSGGKPDANKVPAEATDQQVVSADKVQKNGGSPIGGIGFGVWALLWIGGTLFIKKDGKGNRM